MMHFTASPTITIIFRASTHSSLVKNFLKYHNSERIVRHQSSKHASPVKWILLGVSETLKGAAATAFCPFSKDTVEIFLQQLNIAQMEL